MMVQFVLKPQIIFILHPLKILDTTTRRIMTSRLSMTCFYLLLQVLKLLFQILTLEFCQFPLLNLLQNKDFQQSSNVSHNCFDIWASSFSFSRPHVEIRHYEFPIRWKIVDIRHGPVSTKPEHLAAPLYSPQLRHLTTPIN